MSPEGATDCSHSPERDRPRGGVTNDAAVGLPDHALRRAESTNVLPVLVRTTRLANSLHLRPPPRQLVSSARPGRGYNDALRILIIVSRSMYAWVVQRGGVSVLLSMNRTRRRGVIIDSTALEAKIILAVGSVSSEWIARESALMLCEPPGTVKESAVRVTVQTWWVELAEGGLPNAGTGGGGYVIYRAWILKLTSPPSTAMC